MKNDARSTFKKNPQPSSSQARCLGQTAVLTATPGHWRSSTTTPFLSLTFQILLDVVQWLTGVGSLTMEPSCCNIYTMQCSVLVSSMRPYHQTGWFFLNCVLIRSQVAPLLRNPDDARPIN